MSTYLAYGSGEYTQARATGSALCRLGYRISEDGGALLEPEDASAEAPPLILLSDDTLPAPEAASALARTAAQYCAGRDCGMIADFGRQSAKAAASFLQQLDAAFSAVGASLTVPEFYGEAAPNGNILISSAICGGSFAIRVREAAKQYPGRAVLELEPVCADFALPCPDGSGVRLDRTALEGLRQRYQPQVHDSPALLCRYFFYEEAQSLHIVMFDTKDSLRKKQELAGQEGFLWAVGLYQELEAVIS